jgi:ABC-2 type transport system permease protein
VANRFLRTTAVVAGREIAAYFTSPVAAVIGSLFLLLQGLSFWALVTVLANPREPAPYGAVLRGHFGGSVLYWAVLLSLIAALTMHLCAEEKRRGTWELLFTAGASEVGILTGKHLAALAVYLILWLPTLSYVAVIEFFAPPGAGIDSGPVAGAYLGVALTGAALLALGLAASAATDKQFVAALVTFAAGMLGLLAGEVGDLGSGADALGPLAARQHMREMAGGLIRAEVIAIYLGGTVALIAAAHAIAAAGRRVRAEIGRRALLAVGLASLATAAVAIAAAAGARIDLTRARVHSLEPETAAVLDRVRKPVEVLVIRPAVPGFAAVFTEIDAALTRIAERQPLVEVRELDPATVGEQAAALAHEFAVPPDQLREGGAVILQSAGRRRLLDIVAMAEFEADVHGTLALEELRAESAFARAIAELSDERRHTVCSTRGAGEIPLAAAADEIDWSAVAERLENDGLTLEPIDAAAGEVPAACDAVVVAGPRVAVAPGLAAAIDRYLESGGSLLVAPRTQPTAGASRPPLETGLELVLGDRGLAIAREIVVDPSAEVGLPYVWITYDGYSEHPISLPFQRRRATAWPAPRRIAAPEGATLVAGSPASWGESDRDAVFTGQPVEASEDEPMSRVAVAAAIETESGGRIVVLGSAETAARQLVSRGLGAGHIFVARSIGWLVGRDVDIPLSDKTPEHLRLVLSGAAGRWVFAICVVALPLAWALLGLGLWWRRRRG